MRDSRLTRAAARLLMAGGALACLWAVAGWTTGALARDRARAEWDARQARMAFAAVSRLTTGGEPGARPSPGAPVARLRIPRLGLDEVVLEGVHDDALDAGPGHVPSTPLPGLAGNAVVSAHRDRHFHPLADITTGDTIVTESDAGRVSWVVTGRRVVHRDARVIRQGSTPELTLTTCWPIRYFGPAPERLIVSARPLADVATR